jgi:hypothetical protein
VINRKVKEAFLNGRSAVGNNLVSTGERLLSYGYWEIAKWVDDRVVVRCGPSYSPTTARHRAGIVGQYSLYETPKEEHKMRF